MLDTHSIDLDGVAFEHAVALRTPDGADAPPTAVEQAAGGGDHREAVVVFSAATAAAPRIVVKNVGGIPERIFDWDVPRSR